MFAEDLDVFLADFGLACSANGVAFTGIFDKPDTTMSMAGIDVQSTGYALLVKSDDVAGAAIASGTAITVDGNAYVVRDVLLQDDGAFTQLNLNRV